MARHPRSSTRRAVAISGSVAVVSGLPLFLTGAMGIQVTRELGFGAVGLGLAVAVFRGTGAVASVHLGRLADHIGATRSVGIAGGLALVGALGIATTARTLSVLLVWLAVCGCALAFAQPASNRLLIRLVAPHRLGSAFGIKQSAAPIAAMIAGLSVPAIAGTVGWRWAYVLVAVAALVVLVSTSRTPTNPSRANQGRTPRAGLPQRGLILLVAMAFALADAVSSAITTFYVTAAVTAGTTSEMAGVLLAIGSVAAITIRVIGGYVADRMGSGHLSLCAALLLTGTLGLGLLSTQRPTPMAFGAVLGFAGTWGFNGVFWFAMIRAYSAAPGRITGVLAPGGLLGNAIGPLVFGLIADRQGFAAAWLVFTAVGIAAAAAMHFSGRWLSALTEANGDGTIMGSANDL